MGENGQPKVRIAVLGASSFAEHGHIPGARSHPQAHVVALYSRDLARARDLASRAGVPETTDELEDLLARPDIDAATIASSNDQHYSYAMAALRHGKHVLCEKPMALDAGEAADMTMEAKRRGVVHHMAFTFRYTDCLQEMRRRVASGAIGTPYFVEIHGAWLSRLLASSGPATWRDEPSLYGPGHLGEMGSHFIDTINFVCAPSSGFITEVAAVSLALAREVEAPDGRRRTVRTVDLASFLVRTERGLQGQVLASRATPAPISYGVVHSGAEQRGHMGYVTVTGEQGALMATFTRGEAEALHQMRPGQSWEAVPLPPEAADGQPHAVSRMLAGFVENVLRGRVNAELDATFEDGFRSQAAMDAVVAASQSRRWERVASLPE